MLARHRILRCLLFYINLRKDDSLNKNFNAEQSFTEITATKATPPEIVLPPNLPVYMLKRIGSTTYKVAVHFNQTTNQTANDKIACLIRNESGVSE